MAKMSVIIPTMQKDSAILNMLVDELVNDNNVEEVIIIDNSLRGYFYKSNKVKVVIPDKNMYVNPSWNHGINLAKCEYFAIINDDIILPKNLSSYVIDFINQNPNCGIIGLESSSVIQSKNKNFNEYPMVNTPLFKPINNIYSGKNWFWGSAMFGKKENYYKIPDEMLINSGDNYLIYKNNKNKKQNYAIYNIEVKHYGSLTSASPEFKKIREDDMKFFGRIDKDYRNFRHKERIDKIIRKLHYNKLEKIFSVKNSQNKKYKIICVLNNKFIIEQKIQK